MHCCFLVVINCDLVWMEAHNREEIFFIFSRISPDMVTQRVSSSPSKDERNQPYFTADILPFIARKAQV